MEDDAAASERVSSSKSMKEKKLIPKAGRGKDSTRAKDGKQSMSRLESQTAKIDEEAKFKAALKNQSQQHLKVSGKTVESSPSKAMLTANESTKTMFKKSKIGQRSKSLLKPVSKGGRASSMHRTFSLYGLTSNASTKHLFGEPQSQPLERLADISNFAPGTAANKFYDKHIIQALDRFTEQEVHLKHLKEMKHTIVKMKKGELNKTVTDPRFSTGGAGSTQGASPRTTVIKYPLDTKHELRRLVCHNNHNSGRNFRINEEMMKIYEANIHLQCKLDEIQTKGTGNYNPSTMASTFKSFKNPHNSTLHRRFPSISSPFEPIKEKVKQTSIKGSLNYTIKKKEAQRIQAENLQLAKRII